MTDGSGSRFQRHALTVVVLAGVMLRFVQYLASVSVWIDEASLALNVIDRPLFDLVMRPLDWSQVSPEGFLLAEGLVFRVAGASEYSLRLFPFVCSIAGLLLFRRLAVRVLDPGSAVLATLCFAVAAPLVRYAAEAKPYGIDATATIVLTLVALRIRDDSADTRRLTALAATSSLVLWFSAFAVFAVAGIGAALVLDAALRRDRRGMRDAAIVSAIWGAAALLVTWVSIQSMTPDVRAYMHDYWRQEMLPAQARPLAALAWLGNALSVFFVFALRASWPRMVAVMCAFGFVALWRRRPDVALVLGAPVIVVIAAAFARQYPLFQRLILGLLPAFCIALAASVGWIADRVSTWVSRWPFVPRRVLRASVLAVFALPVLNGALHRIPPYRVEEIKPVLGYVRDHRKPGDGVYVFHAAVHAFQYYRSRYGFETFTPGVRHVTLDPSAFQDVEGMAGQSRVWVVFTGSEAFAAERHEVLAQFDGLGVRRDSVLVHLPQDVKAPNAEAYLYDLARR